MANKKIIDLDNGIPKINSYFESTQVDTSEPAGRKSTKINFTDMGNWVAGQGLSPLEYGNLSTDSKRLVGAINELNSLIAAQYPINEASGAVASFKTQLAAPLVDVTLEINAQQASGTPTPDNPLPITGFTGANIPHTGVNVWNEDWEVGGYSIADGSKIVYPNAIRAKNPFPIKGGITLYSTYGRNLICCFYKNSTYISYVAVYSHTTFVVPSEANYMTFYTYNDYGETYLNDISLNYPSTDTEYHAYNSNSSTISVDWTTEAGTVYGGELDLLSGKLMVYKKYLDAKDANWLIQGNTFVYTNIADTDDSVTTEYPNGKRPILCNIAEYANVSTPQNDKVSWGGSTNNKNLCIQNAYTTSLTDWNTYIENNTIQFVYYIEPIEIQLTPQQITAFVGVNNIWHDANGDTAVKFKQDIQGYIDSKIAEVEAMVLSLP